MDLDYAVSQIAGTHSAPSQKKKDCFDGIQHCGRSSDKVS